MMYSDTYNVHATPNGHVVSFKDLKKGSLLWVSDIVEYGLGAYRLCDGQPGDLPTNWSHRIQIRAGEALLYLGPAYVVCGWPGYDVEFYGRWWACLYMEYIVVVMVNGSTDAFTTGKSDAFLSL